jgi:hypothetical protein
MNVKYHLGLGIIIDLSLGTKGLMTLYSIIPDLPMLVNEVKLLIRKEKFDPLKVNHIIWYAYMLTHSLFILPLIYAISPHGCVAYLIHLICDWFTHTGRFSSRPFHPFPYTITFGREILK